MSSLVITKGSRDHNEYLCCCKEVTLALVMSSTDNILFLYVFLITYWSTLVRNWTRTALTAHRISCFRFFCIFYFFGRVVHWRPQPIRRTSWKLVANPGWQPGFPTSFQLVRLVGCGLKRNSSDFSARQWLTLGTGIIHLDRVHSYSSWLYSSTTWPNNY